MQDPLRLGRLIDRLCDLHFRDRSIYRTYSEGACRVPRNRPLANRRVRDALEPRVSRGNPGRNGINRLLRESIFLDISRRVVTRQGPDSVASNQLFPAGVVAFVWVKVKLPTSHHDPMGRQLRYLQLGHRVSWLA